MDTLIKVLKVIFLSIAILIGLVVLAVLFFVFKGLRSGDLQGYLTKTAVETVLDDDSLTPTQQMYLEEGNYEALVQDLEENITPEQIDCAVQAVGQDRAEELLRTNDPTPQEVLKLSKCL